MESIKDAYRSHYGRDYTRKCGDCKHIIRVSAGNRYVYKCEEIGITASRATDIRRKDPACLLFDRDGEAKVKEPPKVRRVDADTLVKRITSTYDYEISLGDFIGEVELMVRNGGGYTGTWKENPEQEGTWYCSNCGEVTKDSACGMPRANYCPWCGSYNGGGYA